MSSHNRIQAKGTASILDVSSKWQREESKNAGRNIQGSPTHILQAKASHMAKSDNEVCPKATSKNI